MEPRRRINKEKLIVIIGPTASGKSSLAVQIAKKYNGEIISADSRQVYKGLDIGSGKVTGGEKKGVPHHLLDVASPKRKFSVAQYQKLAHQKIDQIVKKNKLPILCGGSGFYVKAITDGIIMSEVAPDWKLRKELNKKTVEELYQILKSVDLQRAKSIEKDNPRRLIRAIEIVIKTKKPVPQIKETHRYNILIMGIQKDQKKLDRAIKKRLDTRLDQGMIKEVENLKKEGLSWKRLESFGLEYEWVAKYLQKKISYEEMREGLLRDIIKFSKKQMNWWKNDQRINWVKNFKESKEVINKFILKKAKN